MMTQLIETPKVLRNFLSTENHCNSLIVDSMFSENRPLVTYLVIVKPGSIRLSDWFAESNHLDFYADYVIAIF
jgi:hypothetical protein